MSRYFRTIALLVAGFFFMSGITSASARTTEFTYQGNLSNSSSPANGNYDIEIDVFDAVPGGNYFNTTAAGKSDIAIWRPSNGNWPIVRREDLSFFGFPFGATGDVVSPGDYDGDGKFDATVFRPASATWFIGRTAAGTQIVQFGTTGDRPIPSVFVP